MSFQSTPACERATQQPELVQIELKFQSTPACERATDASPASTRICRVSIHARVRAGDLPAIASVTVSVPFQSTPACERATPVNVWLAKTVSFQSTPACERATRKLVARRQRGDSFNPRPRASGRLSRRWSEPVSEPFQSTPACERATRVQRPHQRLVGVSIHARVRAGDLMQLSLQSCL